MPKEKEKAGDTPEELNMLFRKNRIYIRTPDKKNVRVCLCSSRVRRRYQKSGREADRAAAKKRHRRMPGKGLDEKLKIMQGLYDMWF